MPIPLDKSGEYAAHRFVHNKKPSSYLEDEGLYAWSWCHHHLPQTKRGLSRFDS